MLSQIKIMQLELVSGCAKQKSCRILALEAVAPPISNAHQFWLFPRLYCTHTSTHTYTDTYIYTPTHTQIHIYKYKDTLHIYTCIQTYACIYTQDLHGHIHTCTDTQIHADTYTQSTCVCQQKYIKIYLTTFSTLKVSTNIDFIHKRYLTDVLSQQDMLAPWCQNSVVTFSKKKKKSWAKPHLIPSVYPQAPRKTRPS